MSLERRRFPRTACYLPVRLFPNGQHRVIETLTKDIGPGGLRCLSPTAQPVSTRLSIELVPGAGETPLTVNAKLSWFQSVGNSKQFYLGIQFDNLSERDTQLLSTYLDSIPPKNTLKKSS